MNKFTFSKANQLSIVSSRLTVNNLELTDKSVVRQLLCSAINVHLMTEKKTKIKLNPAEGFSHKRFEFLTKLLYSSISFLPHSPCKDFIVDLSSLDSSQEDSYPYEKEFVIQPQEDSTAVDLTNYSFDDYELADTLCDQLSSFEEPSPISFTSVALGGSFDHIHNGHKLLLSSLVTNKFKSAGIGLVSDEMLKAKTDPIFLQPYSLRKKTLEDILKDIGFSGKLEINELNSTEGKAGSDPNIDCLLLTEETLKGGQIVNQARVKNNLPEVALVTAQILSQNPNPVDPKEKVSSSDIRNSMFDSQRESVKLLWNEWSDLLAKHTSDSQFALIWFSKLRDLYSESWRFYHNLNHIADFIQAINENECEDEDSLKFACFFHDAIYNGTRKDSEDRSRDLFIEFNKELSQIGGKLDENKICTMIMNTKEHFSGKSYSTEDENFLMDCDLISFGRSKEAVIKNALNIRKEYGFLSDEQWKEGRTNFLKQTLNLQIYKTKQMVDKYEEKAKENIKAEIEYWLN